MMLSFREEAFAQQLTKRGKEIRASAIKLSAQNHGYHYGGSMSCVEILLAIFGQKKPEDIFVMGKGHSCWPYYVLLQEKSLHPKLLGHPTYDPKNGVYYSSGSAGHVFPAAVGMALAKKLKNELGEIIALIGDGECQEGTTWESLLIASHHSLNNLRIVVDKNDVQGSGRVGSILPIEAVSYAANAMSWSVEHVNGHSIDKLEQAIFASLKEFPKMIFAHTVKGKGISFMEDKPEWHARGLSEELFNQALKELSHA